MTKKELCRIAFDEPNCPPNCKGCDPNKLKRFCEWAGKECRGCTGLANDCKSPEPDDKIITISVGKNGSRYEAEISRRTDVSLRELFHILRDVIGVRL